MPSDLTSPPSAAELAQLKQAFSKDPFSEAYHPLAEAYLLSNSYMEAMVVCKKGIKAFPGKAEPHILMARIYAAQKKDAKALDEVKQALERDDSNVDALLLASELSYKSGNSGDGADYLKKAQSLEPGREDVQAACQRRGIQPPEPPAPPPAPVPVAAPAPAAAMPLPTPPAGMQMQPHPSQPSVPAALPQNGSMPPSAPFLQPQMQSQGPYLTPVQQAMAPAYPTPMPSQAPQAAVTLPMQPAVHLQQGAVPGSPSQPPYAAAPIPTPAQVQPSYAAYQAQQNYAALAAKYEDLDEDEERATDKKFPTHIVVLCAVLLVVAGALGGFLYQRSVKAERETEIAKLLKQMQEEISHDNYASYKKACEMGEHITIDLDPTLFSAHSFLAYAYAIRWGEHGEGEVARAPALDHLAKAKKSGQDHSYLNAADAYISFFKGEPDSAISLLEQKIADQDAKGQNSTLLISTLGILETHAGRLESALIHLKKAQQAAPADPRISAWTGNALRRQGGNDVLAANAYEQALRYERNHAEAQLGVALMAVDANKPNAAEKYINMLLQADPPPSTRQIALARLAHAIILDGKGQKAEADAEEQKALASDPDNGELYVMKANRLKRAGKIKEAVEAIRTAIQKEPTRISFQIELAETLLNQKDKETIKDARTSLEKLVAQSPNSLKLLLLLAKAQMKSEEFAKAGETLTKAKDKAVKNEEKAEVLFEQGNLAVYEKRLDDAAKLFEESQKTAVSSRRKALAHLHMGHLRAQQGTPDKATEAYIAAQSADENFAPAYYFLGRLLTLNKDVKDLEIAQQQLEAYLTKDPNGEYVERAKQLLERAKAGK